MATTFQTVTEAQLETLNSVSVDGGKTPSGSPYAAPANYTWKRKEWRISLYRIGEGISSFSSNIGETIAGTSINWQGGNAVWGPTNASTQFEIIDHSVSPEYPGTDMWRESITLVYFGTWELVESSDAEYLLAEWTSEEGASTNWY